MAADSELRRQMFSMIEYWKQSGLTQQAYCRAHSISFNKFHYWHKRYKATNLPITESRPSFVRITPPTPAPVACAEVILPCGTRILFHQPVSGQFLKSLI